LEPIFTATIDSIHSSWIKSNRFYFWIAST
jgi:hypothetical protein